MLKRFNGRNFCRERCMDLVSFDMPGELPFIIILSFVCLCACIVVVLFLFWNWFNNQNYVTDMQGSCILWHAWPAGELLFIINLCRFVCLFVCMFFDSLLFWNWFDNQNDMRDMLVFLYICFLVLSVPI